MDILEEEERREKKNKILKGNPKGIWPGVKKEEETQKRKIGGVFLQQFSLPLNVPDSIQKILRSS